MGDEGALAMAMLLGDRDSLAQEEQLAFQRAGVAHLMAVSGLHVGFLCAGLIWLLNLLPLRKKTHLPVIAAFLLLYCAITGFSPAAVRAAIMMLLLTLGQALGRKQDSLATLSAAALLVLATNPLQLYAAGFILSFTAVGGILLLYSPILSVFTRLFFGKRLKPAQGFLGSLGNRITQLLSVSLSAQIGVLLPTAAFFHKLPLYGIVFNLLAVPLASVLVPLYAVTLLLSFVPCVGWPLAACLGLIAKWGSWLMLRLVELSASLPYAQISISSPNVWAWAAMLLCAVAMSRYVRAPWGIRVLAASLVITLACTGAYLTKPAQLRYHQLAVGQGDAALLFDGDQTVGIDVGTYGTEVAGRLLAEGRSLNALILTHLHSDHAKGVEELLAQGISIGRIYLPDSALNVDLDEESLTVWAAIEQSGVPISYLVAGDTLTFHEMSIRVLWPQAGRTRAGLGANERSIATLITLGTLRILSMGDNSSLYENYIATPCDVLKVGHHGSAASTSDAFLSAVNPGLAIVTCRADAALPSQKTLERLSDHGARVLRTDETGEIILSAVNGGYRLTTYHTGDAQ
jgi:competence protein ComEC